MSRAKPAWDKSLAAATFDPYSTKMKSSNKTLLTIHSDGFNLATQWAGKLRLHILKRPICESNQITRNLFDHISQFVPLKQYTPLPTRGVVSKRVIFHGSVVRSGQILIRSKLSVLLILIMSSEATCILLRLIVLAQDIRLIWYVACSDDSSQHVNTCRAAVG